MCWLVVLAGLAACNRSGDSQTTGAFLDGGADDETGASSDGPPDTGNVSTGPCASVPGTVFVEGGEVYLEHDLLDAPRFESVDDFCLDEMEVTVRRYRLCVEAGGCTTPQETGTGSYNYGDPEREEHPVNAVSPAEAADFCEWAGGRLPTDAEWQWAAQGAEEARTYPWGDSEPTCDVAVIYGTSGSGCGTMQTWEVGSKPAGASRHGAYNLGGNVTEITGSEAETEKGKIYRGGNYRFGLPETIAVATSAFTNPWLLYLVGFRCAADTPDG